MTFSLLHFYTSFYLDWCCSPWKRTNLNLLLYLQVLTLCLCLGCGYVLETKFGIVPEVVLNPSSWGSQERQSAITIKPPTNVCNTSHIPVFTSLNSHLPAFFSGKCLQISGYEDIYRKRWSVGWELLWCSLSSSFVDLQRGVFWLFNGSVI